MQFKKLAIKDRKEFRRFLSLSDHSLSAYAFENIYSWSKILDISWKVISGSLCIFFQDKIGCFMNLAPLSKKISPELIQECFWIMDRANRNPEVSRIENIEEQDLALYRGFGYIAEEKFGDYLCRRQDLADLKGEAFKPKRASFNYFVKHYQFKYLPFSLLKRRGCLKLYDLWMAQRKTKIKDALYQGMLADGRQCLEVLLKNYRDLELEGRVVMVDKKVKAFTFGYPINQETFCILYEITDLAIKGLAQFVFRSFCAELKNYRYINIMDNSGLENLKKVKLSYRPLKVVPAYIVKRAHG